MSIDRFALQGNFSLKDFFQDRAYRARFAIEHPEFFNPSGLVVFCGGQGAGKTLSAVRYIDRLCKRYPDAWLVSNCNLSIPSYQHELLEYTGLNDTGDLDNGYKGIILFLDEIQTEFSSLESNKISPSILQKISQQRKRRLHIVGTSQLFSRIAKPFREQCNVAVDCSCFANCIQINKVIDFGTIAENSNGELTSYEYAFRTMWFRAPRYYDMYNTFERVQRKGGGN